LLYNRNTKKNGQLKIEKNLEINMAVSDLTKIQQINQTFFFKNLLTKKIVQKLSQQINQFLKDNQFKIKKT
jgi:hypothetical protein